MIIGFMRNFTNPSTTAKLFSKVCKGEGLDILYMHPKDVDMENNSVNGRLLVGDKWKRIKTELPRIIDISPYSLTKSKKLSKYLRKNAYLTDNGLNRISKDRLQELFAEDEKFNKYIIPSKHIADFNDILEFIDKYSEVVIKPVNGLMGKGVYRVRKRDDMYVVGFRTSDTEYTEEVFKDFYEKNIANKNHIIQKFICSRTAQQDDPFDCRIHVEKNGSGKWEIAKIYVRIGIGQKVISNVNQGGGIADVKQFLTANFPDKQKVILKKLKGLGNAFPYKIEEVRNTELMTLGMDVGIDENGELYLFEVNSIPTVANIRAEVALLRCEYYKYLIKNII
ncbi:YheC/YheD family protein [Oceanobacillus timonensis]|uniref:YheC/YheD family protein n=1 Tax=Oceanobacillus timonensis TaxID=1926285 RepID=UPI0009B9B493|nr:YheC/YheD family protein [Oceanobacillus timonensis]